MPQQLTEEISGWIRDLLEDRGFVPITTDDAQFVLEFQFGTMGGKVEPEGEEPFTAYMHVFHVLVGKNAPWWFGQVSLTMGDERDPFGDNDERYLEVLRRMIDFLFSHLDEEGDWIAPLDAGQNESQPSAP